MGIKELIEKLRKKDDLYKQMKAEDAAATKLQERKLSAEERALNKIMEKKRQEAIHQELSKHYKKEEKEYWHKDVITQKPLFNHPPTILKQKRLFARAK